MPKQRSSKVVMRISETMGICSSGNRKPSLVSTTPSNWSPLLIPSLTRSYRQFTRPYSDPYHLSSRSIVESKHLTSDFRPQTFLPFESDVCRRRSLISDSEEFY